MSEDLEPYVPLPWERQPHEEWRDFEWFCKWRSSLPADRRITNFSKSVGSSPATVKSVMGKNNWEQRFSLYKQKLYEEKQELEELDRQEMLKRHCSLALQLQHKLEDAIENIESTRLNPRDIATWLDIAVKVDRLSRGEATANVAENRKVDVNIQQQAKKTQETLSDAKSAELACSLLEQLALGVTDMSKLKTIIEGSSETKS
jgi:hypothetical protein